MIVAAGIVIGLVPKKNAGGPLGPDKFTLAKLEEAEKYYKLAIRALGDAVASQKNGLDPQVAAVFARTSKRSMRRSRTARTPFPKIRTTSRRGFISSGAYKDKVDFLDNIIDVKKKSPSAAKTGRGRSPVIPRERSRRSNMRSRKIAKSAVI